MPFAPDTPSSHLTLQFLAWLDEAPRTYGETMNAWRTSCPRLSIWEDARAEGLVTIESGPGTMRDARVVVTAKGKALLRTGDAKSAIDVSLNHRRRHARARREAPRPGHP